MAASSLGAVGGAHAIRTSGPTCTPSPEKSGAVIEPGKSLAEQQRVAIHAKLERFAQRVKEKIENLKFKTDGSGELDDSNASLLGIVIDDTDIVGSGWARSIVGGFTTVGEKGAKPAQFTPPLTTKPPILSQTKGGAQL